MRAFAGANPHQNAVLVVGVYCFDRFADVAGVRYALSRNFENNVALLEPSFGGGALRIDVGYNDAGFAGTRD